MVRIAQSLSIISKNMRGQYRFEGVGICPSCGAGEFKSYSKSFFGLIPLSLKRCGSCGIVIQSPRLDEQSLDRFYDTDYRPIKNEGIYHRHCQRLFERGIRRGRYICKFLEENGIDYQKKLIFEIGCGYGGILEQFRKNGCKVKGCDISPTAVEYGKLKGLDIRIGPTESLSKSGEKADVVILSHVLEHIRKPIALLEKINCLLKSEGVLYLEVPGIKSPRTRRRKIVQIGHLLYFDLDTLSKLLRKTGFDFISGNEIIQSIFQKHITKNRN